MYFKSSLHYNRDNAKSILPVEVIIKLLHVTMFIVLLKNPFVAQSDWIFPYEKNGLFGYTNTCADTITAPIFEEAEETRGGLGRIKYKGRYGFINNDGKIVIKPKYIQASEFLFGKSVVSKQNGKILTITTEGKKYKGPPSELDGTHRVCVTPRLREANIIKANGKYGFIMEKYAGKINGKNQFTPDTLFPKFDTIVAITHQLMYVEYLSKFAFIFDGRFHSGATWIDSSLNFQYDEIVLFPCRFHHDMVDKFIGVREGNLWGYQRIHHEPYVITPCKYLKISTMNRGPALVEYKPGRYGYVDGNATEHFCDQ
jgi:hypothetical protein